MIKTSLLKLFFKASQEDFKKVSFFIFFFSFFTVFSLYGQNQNEHSLWEKKSFGSYCQIKELKEKRSAYAKHFLNEDGKVNAHIATGSIHYQKKERWEIAYRLGQKVFESFNLREKGDGSFHESPCEVDVNKIMISRKCADGLLVQKEAHQINGVIEFNLNFRFRM